MRAMGSIVRRDSGQKAPVASHSHVFWAELLALFLWYVEVLASRGLAQARHGVSPGFTNTCGVVAGRFPLSLSGPEYTVC